jgi:EmrB/QacA subfamily drug resistance transporter
MSDTIIGDKGRQRWIVACAAFATFMGTLDEFIVTICLPRITESFRTGTSLSVWILISYFLMVTSTLILFGKLADRIGVKRLFIAGYAVFVAGSLLCGLSWDIGVLIAARFVQGIGGAILRVVAYALVPRFLPEKVRGRGYGILSTASAAGIMIGAPLGGLIIGHFTWNWIFLVNLPLGLLALLAVLWKLPRDATAPSDQGKFDLPGAALSLAGISLLTFGLNMGHDLGWTSPIILIAFAVSAAAIVLFILREKTVTHPLVDLSLFKNRNFVLGNLAMFMTCMFMSGDSFLLPFYLQVSRDLSAYHAGLIMLAYSAVYIPASQIAGRLSDRFNPALVCGFAMLSGACACLLFALTLQTASFVLLFVYIAWAAVSCAMFISPGNHNVMRRIAPGKQGSASGILGTANQLSGVIGVCLFELVFSAFCETTGSATLDQMRASPDQLTAGIRASYLMAMVICLLAMGFSFLGATGKPPLKEKAAGSRGTP